MPSAGDPVLATDVELEGISIGTVAWTTQSSNGTTTSSTTETRDAVLGSVTFVVAAAQNNTRYKVTASGVGLNGTVANDRFTINFRDGGNATPTATSPQVGVNFNKVIDVIGSNGVEAQTYSSTFVAGTGTHTIGFFLVRTQGTGVAFPSGAREFYVDAMGG